MGHFSLLSISGDFLAGQAQPALLWSRLLGHLASLEKLVPYGRLRIQPIQFQLRSGWSQTRDHPLIQVNLDQGTRDSILWWRTHSSLHKGIPLGSPLIEAFLFTDSSAVGWGAHMDRSASGRWSEAMKELHINVLELNAFSSRIFSRTPMLPLCATMSLPLPIWEIRGALCLNRCAVWPSIPANGPKNGPWHWYPDISLGISMC